MRIIKTAIRKSTAKFLLAGGVLLLSPAAAMFTAGIMPRAVDYMTEAAKYSVYPLTEAADMGSGSLILYVPQPPSGEDGPVPEAEEKHAAYLSVNISDADEDLSKFSGNSGEILEVSYVPNGGTDYIDLPAGGQVRNCTELSPETVYREAVKPHKIRIEPYSGEPQILIIHTHTNESYEPVEKTYYDESYTCRSADPDNSVVAVGTSMAEELASAGIAVLHDGTIHDGQYRGAYERSYVTVSRLLAQYPSIKIVLDVHRDAIEEYDRSRVSAVTEIDGEKAAQVMIISAADDGTYDMPDYLENLRFAAALQQSMESHYPTLTRPVLFQYCQYNQQLSTGSLLIEVGSHGNSVDQAKYSGRLVGRALADMLMTQAVGLSGSVPRYFLDMLR